MRVLSIALGGCLRPPPIALGLTGDTGGHLIYLWGAAAALAKRGDIEHVEIAVRLIDDPTLGAEYAKPCQSSNGKLLISRIATGNSAYLSKEVAAADRPAFTAALIAELERRGNLPDVVHAHFADAAEVAIALRERFGIPFIYTAHSLGTDKADCGLITPDLADRLVLEDQAIAAADAIIASSRDEAERQLMRYPGADAARIYRIAPGAVLDTSARIDTDRPRRSLAPFLRRPELPMLLAIARPVHKKNLPALVDMYATEADLRDRANLVIVAGLRDAPDSGEEEQQEVIQALINRLDRHDLYGSFALPKRHDQDDIAAYYALARETGGIFVNPALTEPYGLTLAEAAHYGVPVVATSHGGAGDIVDNLQHGLVANPGDPAAFAHAIRELLVDKETWSVASNNGRLRSKNLSWDAYAKHFVAIASSLKTLPRRLQTGEDLLLCDIDHTLTGCRDGARELVLHLASRPRRLFGIATGRSLQEARRILGEWGYPDPAVWITSVGSEIAWMKDGRLVADNEFADYLSAGWDPGAITALLADYPGIVPQTEVEQRRFKRSWFAPDHATAIRIRARLMREGLPARVIFSHGRFLDILPARGGKGEAMCWVADRLGLPLSAVHAAGDSGNDFDMLEACPNAILVANHSVELTPLISRAGVRVAERPHAGGIVDLMSAHDEGSSNAGLEWAAA
ncbi:MAG: HAD-IIB family hydrolase [Sphingorhabdus sp.]